MDSTTLNDLYRNGGDMNESEPHNWDLVDAFNRAAQDHRVMANQLRSMGCLVGADDIFLDGEEEE